LISLILVRSSTPALLITQAVSGDEAHKLVLGRQSERCRRDQRPSHP
jgi:hypothetical protein